MRGLRDIVPAVTSERKVQESTSGVLDLLTRVTRVLFVNGETTEQTVGWGVRAAEALGFRATVIPRWGELSYRVEGPQGPVHDVEAAAPVAVNMNRVIGTVRAVDRFLSGQATLDETRSALAAAAVLPGVSLGRFALATVVAACCLAAIFGAERPSTYPLIAVSAAIGAVVRRGLGKVSPNQLLQPFAAALVAGLIGGLAQRLELSSSLALVAVCPCMILVPGPHFLNGLLDVVRARIALGASRLGFAAAVTAAISAGLLIGLWLVGATLPPFAPSRPVPLWIDALAAGLVVAGYASFFSIPWRFLPLPMLVGACAHAVRWYALSEGATAFAGAFLACLLVGAVISPLADRMRVPYAGLAFAAVVSLIPGVFVFRMASGVVELARLGENAAQPLVLAVVADASTALTLLVAMGIGLILPKLCAEAFRPSDHVQPA